MQQGERTELTAEEQDILLIQVLLRNEELACTEQEMFRRKSKSLSLRRDSSAAGSIPEAFPFATAIDGALLCASAKSEESVVEINFKQSDNKRANIVSYAAR